MKTVQLFTGWFPFAPFFGLTCFLPLGFPIGLYGQAPTDGANRMTPLPAAPSPAQFHH